MGVGFNRDEWAGRFARRIECILAGGWRPGGPDFREAATVLEQARREWAARAVRSAVEWESSPLGDLPGVDPATVSIVSARGVVSVGEFLRAFPTRESFVEASQLGEGRFDLLRAALASVGVRWPRYEMANGILAWLPDLRG